MSVYSYKCPNCGASLEYKPQNGLLSCEYCLSSFTEEEIDKYLKENPDAIEEQSKDSEDNHIHHNHKDNDYKIRGYNCASCGAEVVTDDTTLTTFCYYCHSPVVITDRVQGEFKPNKVIPFKFDKEEAQRRFLAWVKNKRYVPKSFYSQSQLEKITGMYLPYWGIDSKFNLDLKGVGYKKHVYMSGRTEYTETSSYEIIRKGNFSIDNVMELAYSKADKGLIDSITPYDLKEAQDFKVYYLNGFFSEIYDKKKEDVEATLRKRILSYQTSYIEDLFIGYDRKNIEKREIKLDSEKWNYTLLPAWMLTYDYQGKKYIYAMNGQSGKSFGELPIDKSLIFRDSLIFSIIIIVLTLLGGKFIW